MLSVNNKIIQITIESNSNVLQIIDPDWRMSVLFPICQCLYWHTCHCCELFSCYMFFFPDVPDLINVQKQLLSPPVTFWYILHNFTKNSIVMEQENAIEYYDKAITSEICCIFIKICYNIGKYIILFFTSFRMYDFLFLPRLFFCGI